MVSYKVKNYKTFKIPSTLYTNATGVPKNLNENSQETGFKNKNAVSDDHHFYWTIKNAFLQQECQTIFQSFLVTIGLQQVNSSYQRFWHQIKDTLVKT